MDCNRHHLAAPLLALLALTPASAQRSLGLEADLLLPTMPMVGSLGFTADGRCSSRPLVSGEAYGLLLPVHQRMLATLLARADFARTRSGWPAVACWHTPPSPQVAALLEALLQGPSGFQVSGSWPATAHQSGPLLRGDPIVLTVSFVPDGTAIPGSFGEPPAPSNLFAALNGVFSSQATWQNRIIAAVNRWGSMTGVTYEFVGDDGAAMFGNPGVLGVRGDIRIGGHFIDGGGSILGYNFLPDGGDMVLDTSDTTLFSSPANNFRFLFNTVAHEAGHGLGIHHVCPNDGTKVMEAFITTGWDGPQFDDVLSGQRLYGDDREPNDSASAPADLGTLADGDTTAGNLSLDGLSDDDHFRFSLTNHKVVTVTLHPLGSTYLEGPASVLCTGTTTPLSPQLFRNLDLIVTDATGTSVLATAATQPAGDDEAVNGLTLAPGSYLVRVVGDQVDQIQMYELRFTVVDNGPLAQANQVGNGCGGITWHPVGRPLLGTTQTISWVGVPSPFSSIGLALLGTSPIPGGFDLGPLGAPSCNLYVDVLDIQVVLATPGVSFAWRLPIPNNQSFAGIEIWTQGGLLVPPGTNSLGALTGNAVQLVLGTH